MTYIIPGGLPSLAHPLIGNPAIEPRKSKRDGFQPPFPEINLSWNGFTLSHLHWIGVNKAYHIQWKVGLFLRHEIYHNSLGLTAFSRLKKNEVYALYRLILEILENDKKRERKILVPLRSDLGRNALEKRWGFLVGLHEASELVDEVYAVRYSILETKDVNNMDPDELQPLIRKSKREYNRYIDGFKKAYNALDFMAGEIGEHAVKGLVHSAFQTLHPTAAFLTILFFLCEIDLHSSSKSFRWTLPREKTRALAGLSTEEACNSFGHLIEEADLDDSLYGRRLLLRLMLEIEKRFENLSQGIGDDFYDLLINPSPKVFWLSYYGDEIDPFALIDLSTLEVKGRIEQKLEDYYGKYAVLIEAIRQQISAGRGLLCPFWTECQGCCDPQYKALLENVWSCTKPDSSCNSWERLGCLR